MLTSNYWCQFTKINNWQWITVTYYHSLHKAIFCFKGRFQALLMPHLFYRNRLSRNFSVEYSAFAGGKRRAVTRKGMMSEENGEAYGNSDNKRHCKLMQKVANHARTSVRGNGNVVQLKERLESTLNQFMSAGDGPYEWYDVKYKQVMEMMDGIHENGVENIAEVKQESDLSESEDLNEEKVEQIDDDALDEETGDVLEEILDGVINVEMTEIVYNDNEDRWKGQWW